MGMFTRVWKSCPTVFCTFRTDRKIRSKSVLSTKMTGTKQSQREGKPKSQSPLGTVGLKRVDYNRDRQKHQTCPPANKTRATFPSAIILCPKEVYLSLSSGSRSSSDTYFYNDYISLNPTPGYSDILSYTLFSFPLWLIELKHKSRERIISKLRHYNQRTPGSST